MLLDQYEEPLSEAERSELIAHQALRLSYWLRRALVSWSILLIGTAAVVMLSAGHPLHAYWNPFGRLLVIFCEITMMTTLYCSILIYYAWKLLRETRKPTNVI